MDERPRLTAAEFEAMLPRLGRLTLDSLRIARAIVVDGQKTADVARATGYTRQRVHAILKRFELAMLEIPPSWRRVEVWLPPALADQVEAMAEEARQAHAAGAGKGNSGASL